MANMSFDFPGWGTGLISLHTLISAQFLTQTHNPCVEVDDEHKAVIITKPESRRRSAQIGIDDFGELVRSDTNLTHNFFFDLVFGPR